MSWLTVFGVCALSVAAAAQRTWIVDANNGPGTDFVNLPPALAAASDGDVLLVRPGAYRAFATSKGVTILGTPGQTRVLGSYFVEAMSVAGLPAGRTFRARDLTFVGSAEQMIGLMANQGAVVLEAMDADIGTPILTFAVASCQTVTLRDCGKASPACGVMVNRSRVSIVDCRLRGIDAAGDPRVASWRASSALMVDTGAVVEVADTVLTGGDGVAIWPYLGDYWPSAAAVSLNGGDLRLRAGAAGAVAAGNGAVVTLPVSAIVGVGRLRRDARVPVLPFAGAVPVAASVQDTVGSEPGLTLSGGALGLPLVLVYTGTANQPVALAAGTWAASGGAFGELWLDPGSLLLVSPLVADPAGVAAWSVPLPNNPRLVGVTLGWQAAAPRGAALQFANPTASLLR